MKHKMLVREAEAHDLSDRLHTNWLYLSKKIDDTSATRHPIVRLQCIKPGIQDGCAPLGWAEKHADRS